MQSIKETASFLGIKRACIQKVLALHTACKNACLFSWTNKQEKTERRPKLLEICNAFDELLKHANSWRTTENSHGLVQRCADGDSTVFMADHFNDYDEDGGGFSNCKTYAHEHRDLTHCLRIGYNEWCEEAKKTLIKQKAGSCNVTRARISQKLTLNPHWALTIKIDILK